MVVVVVLPDHSRGMGVRRNFTETQFQKYRFLSVKYYTKHYSRKKFGQNFFNLRMFEHLKNEGWTGIKLKFPFQKSYSL